MDMEDVNEPYCIYITDAYGLALHTSIILKAILFFSIVAINSPSAMLVNLSILMFVYKVLSLWDSSIDPRITMGIDLQTIVSWLFIVMVGELLLVLSMGAIAFYTTHVLVFYISIVVGDCDSHINP